VIVDRFVSDAASIDDPERTASLVEAGLPWPLWNNRDWQRMLQNVADTHAAFLKMVFRPTAPLTDEHWTDIAQQIGQDVAIVQEVKLVLLSYIDCLTTYWRLTAVWNN